jgi:hypothetical protein
VRACIRMCLFVLPMPPSVLFIFHARTRAYLRGIGRAHYHTIFSRFFTRTLFREERVCVCVRSKQRNNPHKNKKIHHGTDFQHKDRESQTNIKRNAKRGDMQVYVRACVCVAEKQLRERRNQRTRVIQWKPTHTCHSMELGSIRHSKLNSRTDLYLPGPKP